MLANLSSTVFLNSQKKQVDNDMINNASFEEHPNKKTNKVHFYYENVIFFFEFANVTKYV
jgi:hypothetical protein